MKFTLNIAYIAVWVLAFFFIIKPTYEIFSAYGPEMTADDIVAKGTVIIIALFILAPVGIIVKKIKKHFYDD